MSYDAGLLLPRNAGICQIAFFIPSFDYPWAWAGAWGCAPIASLLRDCRLAIGDFILTPGGTIVPWATNER
jgi:hypothetical protein